MCGSDYFNCREIKPSISNYDPDRFNSQKGGLATLLFQDSDHHIGNDGYIKKDDKFYYTRLDVDHADFVYVPLLSHFRNSSKLAKMLTDYGFSCESLNILVELLAMRPIFRQSVLKSLNQVAEAFTDDAIKDAYSGAQPFKQGHDASWHYRPINLSGNQALKEMILSNFDKVFDYAQASLDELYLKHDFALGGVVCNPLDEM